MGQRSTYVMLVLWFFDKKIPAPKKVREFVDQFALSAAGQLIALRIERDAAGGRVGGQPRLVDSVSAQVCLCGLGGGEAVQACLPGLRGGLGPAKVEGKRATSFNMAVGVLATGFNFEAEGGDGRHGGGGDVQDL